mgnify:CR=1 FL=1
MDWLATTQEHSINVKGYGNRIPACVYKWGKKTQECIRCIEREIKRKTYETEEREREREREREKEEEEEEEEEETYTNKGEKEVMMMMIASHMGPINHLRRIAVGQTLRTFKEQG